MKKGKLIFGVDGCVCSVCGRNTKENEWLGM